MADSIIIMAPATADALGGQALQAIATLRGNIVIPSNGGRHHDGRAYHPDKGYSAATDILQRFKRLPDDPDTVAAKVEASNALAAWDGRINEMAGRIVGEDVRYCVSALIATLGAREWDGSDGVDPDDLIGLSYRQPDAGDYADAVDTKGGKPLYEIESGDDGYRWTENRDLIGDEPAEAGDWHETELEAWRECFDANGLDQPDGSEVFEHWLVTDWLAEKLEAKGEAVARDVAGLTVWGRCTTGQAIKMDAVICDIARDVLEA